MWRGQLSFTTPMLFLIGFLITFLIGGLTEVLLALPAVDWHVTDRHLLRGGTFPLCALRQDSVTPWSGPPPAPPPRHNFTELPRIRSERPAFELHYPHMTRRIRAEAHVGERHLPAPPR
jgi:hypothetical protein